jgi:MORN repeat
MSWKRKNPKSNQYEVEFDEGDWHQGHLEGDVHQKRINEVSFTGRMSDGKRSGKGTLNTPTLKYDGHWENDLKHGSGKETCIDGTEVNAEF